MIYEKDVKEDVAELQGLKNLVEVYGEIASSRMKKIREFVLRNREFLNAIHDVFDDVLASYARRLSALARQKKFQKGKITFLAHNGKTVCVLVSANTGFYGDVVQEIFRVYINDIKEQNVEVTIIGKLGLTLFADSAPGRPYTYFSLPDYGTDSNKMTELINHLVQYEEIRVYYGQYQSVVTQKPDKLTITSGATYRPSGNRQVVEYIFEPDIEKILVFFETEIFASLFDQALRESQLAKFASRIMAMDAAGENIRKEIREMNLLRLRMEHAAMNRKQLDLLSGIKHTKF